MHGKENAPCCSSPRRLLLHPWCPPPFPRLSPYPCRTTTGPSPFYLWSKLLQWPAKRDIGWERRAEKRAGRGPASSDWRARGLAAQAGATPSHSVCRRAASAGSASTLIPAPLEEACGLGSSVHRAFDRCSSRVSLPLNRVRCSPGSPI